MSRTPLIILILVMLLAGCGGIPGIGPSQDESTPDDVELTTTAIVAQATESGPAVSQAEPVPTVRVPEGPCTPGFYNRFLGDFSERAQGALEAGGIENPAVSVITSEETTDCEDARVLSVLYAINVPAADLNDEAALNASTEAIIGILAGLRGENIVPFRPVSLSLRFDHGDQQRIIDADFLTVVRMYNEGRRGADLVNALGGLSGVSEN